MPDECTIFQFIQVLIWWNLLIWDGFKQYNVKFVCQKSQSERWIHIFYDNLLIYRIHHLLAFIAQGVMLAFWPFVVQKEKRLIRISTKSSNTSNNMDTEIPRYNDREPPIADTMVPVICKMRLYPIGYLLSFMPL